MVPSVALISVPCFLRPDALPKMLTARMTAIRDPKSSSMLTRTPLYGRASALCSQSSVQWTSFRVPNKHQTAGRTLCRSNMKETETENETMASNSSSEPIGDNDEVEINEEVDGSHAVLSVIMPMSTPRVPDPKAVRAVARVSC